MNRNEKPGNDSRAKIRVSAVEKVIKHDKNRIFKEKLKMINTEIFEVKNCNNYKCFDEALKHINDLIKENRIKREDIVEYRTENWTSDKYFHYRVTISWWE